MTWWQTLLVAMLPAALTGTFLLFQSERTALRQSRTDLARERRAEMRTAHRDALAAAERVERAATQSALEVEESLRRGYSRPANISLSEYTGPFMAADAAVHLMCSVESQQALRRYFSAVSRISAVAGADSPTVLEIEQAFDEADAARSHYITVAKAELEIPV